MNRLKTIAGTAAIAVAATALAFGGLHLGQPSADASGTAPVKAKTTYTITMSPQQLAKLMRGQNNKSTPHARHTARPARQHPRTRHSASSGRRYSGNYSQSSYRSGGSSRSYGSSSRSYGGSYRCYGSGGGRSGSGWGGSGRGYGGGCW